MVDLNEAVKQITEKTKKRGQRPSTRRTKNKGIVPVKGWGGLTGNSTSIYNHSNIATIAKVLNESRPRLGASASPLVKYQWRQVVNSFSYLLEDEAKRHGLTFDKKAFHIAAGDDETMDG